MSVTHLSWFDEDKKFAVAFNDGLIYMASKEEFEEPIIVEAHQVNTHIASIVRLTSINNWDDVSVYCFPGWLISEMLATYDNKITKNSNEILDSYLSLRN